MPEHENRGVSPPGYTAYGLAWDDLRVPLTSAKLTGASDPSFLKWRDDGSGSTGVYAYSFDDGTEQQLFFIAQLPHSYSEGTDLYVHTHWGVNTTTATGTLIWGLEWTLAGKDESFATTTLSTATYEFTENIQYKEQINALVTIPGTTSGGVKISDLLVCRFYRDASSDTFADPAFCFEVDIHFQADSNGTLNEFSGKPTD